MCFISNTSIILADFVTLKNHTNTMKTEVCASVSGPVTMSPVSTNGTSKQKNLLENLIKVLDIFSRRCKYHMIVSKWNVYPHIY